MWKWMCMSLLMLSSIVSAQDDQAEVRLPPGFVVAKEYDGPKLYRLFIKQAAANGYAIDDLSALTAEQRERYLARFIEVFSMPEAERAYLRIMPTYYLDEALGESFSMFVKWAMLNATRYAEPAEYERIFIRNNIVQLGYPLKDCSANDKKSITIENHAKYMKALGIDATSYDYVMWHLDLIARSFSRPAERTIEDRLSIFLRNAWDTMVITDEVNAAADAEIVAIYKKEGSSVNWRLAEDCINLRHRYRRVMAYPEDVKRTLYQQNIAHHAREVTGEVEGNMLLTGALRLQGEKGTHVRIHDSMP